MKVHRISSKVFSLLLPVKIFAQTIENMASIYWYFPKAITKLSQGSRKGVQWPTRFPSLFTHFCLAVSCRLYTSDFVLLFWNIRNVYDSFRSMTSQIFCLFMNTPKTNYFSMISLANFLRVKLKWKRNILDVNFLQLVYYVYTTVKQVMLILELQYNHFPFFAVADEWWNF